jgi:hypothetical protein
MSIRREPILLSWEVFGRLRLIAKARSPVGDTERIMTPDAVADDMLHDAIKEKYPQFIEYEKKRDKDDREFIKTLIT